MHTFARMEDGEINDGFLGAEEMENRKALAASHGEGAMSWVEAVMLGAGHVTHMDQAATDEANAEASEASAGAGAGAAAFVSLSLEFFFFACSGRGRLFCAAAALVAD